MDDGEAVGIDRPLRLLGNEVVDDAQKARGQEEAHRIVAVPPLDQRILHAGEQRIALGLQQRHRHRQVVDDVQHRDGGDEGQIEPVGHIDVRFLALDDRAQEGQQVADPHDGEPDVHVPFRLGILAPFGDAQQIAGARHQNEDIVAPEHEPGQRPAPQPRLAGALHDIEGGRDQHIAAERKDHGRGVQRPQTAKAGPHPVREVENIGEGQLQRDDEAHQHAGDAPEDRGDDAGLDHAVGVGPAVIGSLAARMHPQVPDADRRHAGGKGPALNDHGRIGRLGGLEQAGQETQAQNYRQHQKVDAPGNRSFSLRLHDRPSACRSGAVPAG